MLALLSPVIYIVQICVRFVAENFYVWIFSQSIAASDLIFTALCTISAEIRQNFAYWKYILGK